MISVAIALLTLSGALVLAKTGRDALFIEEGGLFDLRR